MSPRAWPSGRCVLGLPRLDGFERGDLLVGQPFEYVVTPTSLAQNPDSQRARGRAAFVEDHAGVRLADTGRRAEVGNCRGAVHGLDTSHIVMINAIADYHNLGGALPITICDAYGMASDDKNGGPNHLKAWRELRGLSQQQLGEDVGTTQHQIAYLESGERGLSAKWLRKLSAALDTTPGMLLDHDPNDLDADIIEIWATASNRQKRQLAEIARTILKTGTDGE